MKMDLDNRIISIFNLFELNGFEIYLVGGCVRDVLLGKTPKDYDFTTNATPQEMIKLCKDNSIKYIETGLQHGTLTLRIGHQNYEATTYRVDTKAIDYRHSEVVFVDNLKSDLSRRDFTINAMAYNPSLGIVDMYGGQSDLNLRIIRTVGASESRFKEDGLRMLRAIRFACELKFEIDKETLLGIEKNNELIKHISFERIKCELDKIVLSDLTFGINNLAITHLLQHIIPELEECCDVLQNNPNHVYDVYWHSLKSATSMMELLSFNLTENDYLNQYIKNTDGKSKDSFIIRMIYIMLFHDLGKACTKTTDENGIDHFYGHGIVSSKIALTILKRLKFAKKERSFIIKMIKYHDYQIHKKPKSFYKLMVNHSFNEEELMCLFLVKIADTHAQSPTVRNIKIENIYKLVDYYFEEIKSRPKSIKDLKVDGYDLKNQGYKNSEIGKRLNEILTHCYYNPKCNTKEYWLNKNKE